VPQHFICFTYFLVCVFVTGSLLLNAEVFLNYKNNCYPTARLML